VILNNLYNDLEFYPDKYKTHSVHNNEVHLISENGVQLKLTLLNERIFQFKYAPDGFYDKTISYALNPEFEHTQTHFTTEDRDHTLIVSTPLLNIHISKEYFLITIYNKKGQIINEDEKGFHWEENSEYGGNIVQMSKKVQPGESYFGLGDKASDFNIVGKRFENWGTDNYGYNMDSDPLYKNIPFYYGLASGEGYGIFYDNTFKSFFDFASERNAATSFWSHGGEMNYYFIYGPELITVSKEYAKLTGTTELPAQWTLGYQQCKWSYYPESKVKEITSKLREYKIPCDAIYLDIDYMDGFRCFTWDKEKFPNPKAMVEDFKSQGFRTVVIIDPGIKKDPDYWVYQEGLINDYFCRLSDGDFMKGKVWPGECFFPDYTNPEAREWWAGLFGELIEEVGVEGVWNDMNEPALFEVKSKTFLPNVMHNMDGHPSSHRRAHNVYGMQMARATYDGVKKFNNGKRPLIITRSGYSGVQRFSSVWTGDNLASWDHLSLASIQVQRLCISGISFCGSDVGGFIGQPSGELFVRWMQLATFHPFFRNHSSGDHGDQEPWTFGEEYLNDVRKTIELRYQLLPYLYSTFYKHSTEGSPFILPMIFFDQYDKENLYRDQEFLVGDKMVVAPVLREGQENLRYYLPRGTWYHFYKEEKQAGRKEYIEKTELDTIPFFIKAGTVLPIYPVQQYTDQLVLESYKEGDYRKAVFTLSGKAKETVLTQQIEGTFKPSYTQYKLSFVGFPDEINSIEVDGGVYERKDNEGIVVPANFSEIKI
jgi:alpha-glucosidase